MPEEQGTVIRTYGDRALVRTRRNSACEGCSHTGACHAMGGAHDVMEVEARNQAGARAGDTVVLELSDSVFLSASFAVYVVPVVGFVLGALGGNALGEHFGGDADLWAFLAGLALCGAAFGLVRFVLALFPGHEQALMPTIVRRASNTASSKDSECSL